ncbi:hypothetical protein TNIN_29891 [Trichonephila inaurata madagascariensis]|uniref:GST N-terminal domain-containing protein n=1 Tax=Trichonephila inaurata madagascariensis TaxID=2747483 RepID=A0A8X6YIC2_9ARAC|nr:hypothetical protein TNIN_29891 [Trichonephila inaurata madagascariensis]
MHSPYIVLPIGLFLIGKPVFKEPSTRGEGPNVTEEQLQTLTRKAEMARYRLLDYSFTTAAELARAILEFAGQPFEDKRFDKDKAQEAESGKCLALNIHTHPTFF